MSAVHSVRSPADRGFFFFDRWFDAQGITPRFEFGFGLSYTTFAYSGLAIGHAGGKREVEHSSPRSTSAAVSSSAVSRTSSAASASSTVRTSSAPSTSTALSSLSSQSASSILSSSASLSTPPVLSSSISASATSSAASSGATTLSISATGNATSTTASAPPATSSPSTQIGGPAALFRPLYTVSYTVHNTGRVGGNEVSQLYLTFPASAGEAPKTLRGFARSFVGAGARAQVTLTLRRKDVSVWDVVAQAWVVPSGTFTVHVGSSSRNLPLTGQFTV